MASDYSTYVVIGAGKTGMDACIWLLGNGADPESIVWIMPRDSWLLNRANFQPGEEFFERAAKSSADQVEALALADSVDDVFARLEAEEEVRRIDPAVTPAAYHCAIVSDGELEQLRRIRNIVRLGRVTRIDADQIVLEHGVVPTGADALHVDCSAPGIPPRPTKPVFDGDRITLQWVRLCQPAFSAALIGRVEAVFDDETTKNRICTPIAPPTVPSDWLRMMAVELGNRHCWSEHPEILEWQTKSRLDFFTRQLRSLTGEEAGVIAHVQRYLQHVGAAVTNLELLLESDPLSPRCDSVRK